MVKVSDLQLDITDVTQHQDQPFSINVSTEKDKNQHAPIQFPGSSYYNPSNTTDLGPSINTVTKHVLFMFNHSYLYQ